jgi:hypothetical protein
MRLYLNRLIDWLDAAAHRTAERIAFGLLDRFGDGTGLDEAQRAWLLEDVKEDLAAMVDDAENRGVTERAAGEMLVIRALEEVGNPNPDPQCLAAAKAFINNWDRRLKEAYGATMTGLYGPSEGAHVKQFWNLNYKPDDLWFSEVQKREGHRFVENEEHQSVWNVPKSRLPEEYWINRLHQWEVNGNYIADNGDETPLDLDCARGYIAGSGEDR